MTLKEIRTHLARCEAADLEEHGAVMCLHHDEVRYLLDLYNALALISPPREREPSDQACGD